ncbi:hypothetical protein D3C85_1125730 [compost metagenome]
MQVAEGKTGNNVKVTSFERQNLRLIGYFARATIYVINAVIGTNYVAVIPFS